LPFARSQVLKPDGSPGRLLCGGNASDCNVSLRQASMNSSSRLDNFRSQRNPMGVSGDGRDEQG
jgi:hypothetical protein